MSIYFKYILNIFNIHQCILNKNIGNIPSIYNIPIFSVLISRSLINKGQDIRNMSNYCQYTPSKRQNNVNISSNYSLYLNVF